MDHARIEVHVPPLNSQKFLNAHPCVGVGRDQRAIPVRCMRDQPVDIVSREHTRGVLRPSARQLLARKPVERILGDVPASDCQSRVYEEEAEEGALFWTPERECLLAHGDFKRPENAKLEIRMLLRGSMVRPSFYGACSRLFAPRTRRV